MDKKTTLLPFFISESESIKDILPTSESGTAIQRGILLEQRKLDRTIPVYDEYGLVDEEIIYWHPSADSLDIIERGTELVKKGIGFDIKNTKKSKGRGRLESFLHPTNRK
ncbi:hypothetical protein GINT2_000492 [Glugoides intestinalis]